MSGATVVSTDNADLFQLVQWNLVETVQNTIDSVIGSTVQTQQHCLNMGVILVLQVAAQLLLTSSISKMNDTNRPSLCTLRLKRRRLGRRGICLLTISTSILFPKRGRGASSSFRGAPPWSITLLYRDTENPIVRRYYRSPGNGTSNCYASVEDRSRRAHGRTRNRILLSIEG